MHRIISTFFSRRGVSLIELLVAVILIVAAVTSLSLFFPQSSRSIVVNHQNQTASKLAQSFMQTAKAIPYDLLIVPPSSSFTTAPASCDCTATFVASLTPALNPIITVVSGVSYTQQACVEYVKFASINITPNNDCSFDDGLKRIYVQVIWDYGTDAAGNPMKHLVSLESMASRL